MALLNAKTTLLFLLAAERISRIRLVGVSMVPLVKLPSKSMMPLQVVLVRLPCSQCSRRLAKRVGICISGGVDW